MANLDKYFDSKGRELTNALERSITLTLIDDSWKEHLREMDDLKQSVQGAVYEQKDPLLIYKFEAFNLFKKMMGEVNREVISFLFKGSLPNQQVNQAQSPQRTDYSRMREGRGTEMKPALNGVNGSNGELHNGEQVNGEQPEQKKLEPIRVGPKIGRNDPCPCGSGKKYKNCHGKES